MPSTPFPIQNPNFTPAPYLGQPMPGNWSPGAATVAGPPRVPVPAALAAGIGNPIAAPRPTIRMQAPDPVPAPPPRQTLPSPEALGISVANPAPSAQSLDWNVAHARLERLGALGFHLDRLAPSKIRAMFMLPAGDHGAHQIEVVADNEAAAVNAALETAEAWATARQNVLPPGH
jgi:hypothetical protein